MNTTKIYKNLGYFTYVGYENQKTFKNLGYFGYFGYENQKTFKNLGYFGYFGYLGPFDKWAGRSLKWEAGAVGRSI